MTNQPWFPYAVNLLTTLIGAGFGSWFGAYAAFRFQREKVLPRQEEFARRLAEAAAASEARLQAELASRAEAFQAKQEEEQQAALAAAEMAAQARETATLAREEAFRAKLAAEQHTLQAELAGKMALLDTKLVQNVGSIAENMPPLIAAIENRK